MLRKIRSKIAAHSARDALPADEMAIASTTVH